jgi:hypothetical protein
MLAFAPTPSTTRGDLRPAWPDPNPRAVGSISTSSERAEEGGGVRRSCEDDDGATRTTAGDDDRQRRRRHNGGAEEEGAGSRQPPPPPPTATDDAIDDADTGSPGLYVDLADHTTAAAVENDDRNRPILVLIGGGWRLRPTASIPPLDFLGAHYRMYKKESFGERPPPFSPLSPLNITNNSIF